MSNSCSLPPEFWFGGKIIPAPHIAGFRTVFLVFSTNVDTYYQFYRWFWLQGLSEKHICLRIRDRFIESKDFCGMAVRIIIASVYAKCKAKSAYLHACAFCSVALKISDVARSERCGGVTRFAMQGGP